MSLLNREVAHATFTRPADTTAYASGDLIANSVTAGSVVAMTVSAARIRNVRGEVKRVRLHKSGATPTNAAIRVHFFEQLPTFTNGDNAAFLPATMDKGYLGYCDVAAMIPGTAGCVGHAIPAVGTGMIFEPAVGTRDIYAVLEARAAYTPASAEVFTLHVELNRD